MKRSFVLLPIALFFIFSCDEKAAGTESCDSDSVYSDLLLIPEQLPGILIAPTGDTVQALPGTDIVLYYWLPLNKYDEAQHDLRFLASLDTTYLALPVQPDHESRNHAQRVVNNMEISLPVYLADSAIMERMDSEILPFCLILTHEGEEISKTGFGAPSRILTSIHSVE